MSNEFSHEDLLAKVKQNLDAIGNRNTGPFDRSTLQTKKVIIRDPAQALWKKIFLTIYRFNYRTILHYFFQIPIIGSLSHALLILPRLSRHFDKVRTYNHELQAMVVELEKDLSQKHYELENMTKSKIRALEIEVRKLKSGASS